MNKRIIAGTGASLGTILVLPAAAQAEDFRVTNLNDDGAGSLREAISAANATPSADRVLFQSKLSGTIQLGNDALYISESDLDIVGPGARNVTVRGGETTVFGVIATYDGLPPVDVSISGLTITGGEGGNEFGFFLGNYAGGIGTFGDVDLTLSKVTIAGNTSPEQGGGIAVATGGQAPNLVLENSTISGNTADDDGGGIYFGGGTISVRNSTISGNTADDGAGGAEVHDDAEFRNSTITDNEASSGGGIVEYSGAILRGTIVADNSALDDPNLDDGTWDTSFSLIGEAPNSNFDDLGGNLFDADPLLKPLANNGGPTDTHAFKKSPAKNAGPDDAPGSDQRGAPRKGQPDIGAYELTKCKGVIVNRVGTAKKDKLKGTKKKDGILGLGGNDKLSGKKGKDGLCGGKGKDKLKGGPGKDKLDGGPGKDKLDGGPGKDKLDGGPGKDKEIQ
jgi:parallel beta-helix repeat protein